MLVPVVEVNYSVLGLSYRLIIVFYLLLNTWLQLQPSHNADVILLDPLTP